MDKAVIPGQDLERDKAVITWTMFRIGRLNQDKIYNGRRQLYPRQDLEWDKEVITWTREEKGESVKSLIN